TARRGLSFSPSGPLDMRMDQSEGVPTAADLARELGERELAHIFYEYGDERESRRAARANVERPKHGPALTTADLAADVAGAPWPPDVWRNRPGNDGFPGFTNCRQP